MKGTKMFAFVTFAFVIAIMTLVAIIAAIMDCVKNEYVAFMLDNFEDEIEVEVL